MKLLSLSRGRSAIIDDEDYETLSQYPWYCSVKPHGSDFTYYACSRRLGLMHRFITNCPRGLVVDHINGDGLDNRRANLRICTQQQNCASQRVGRNPTGFKGVRRLRNKYQARLNINYGTIYLGVFPTAFEAAKAYDRAAVEHFGEFATPNFPKSALSKAINAIVRERK